MNESQREKAFPVHIELGVTHKGMAMPTEADKSDEMKSYPVLYISGVKGLDKIPAKGCMLVDYELTGFHKNQHGPTSVELSCHTICLQREDVEDSGNEHEDVSDTIDELARKIGLNMGEEESAEHEAEETPEEEAVEEEES